MLLVLVTAIVATEVCARFTGLAVIVRWLSTTNGVEFEFTIPRLFRVKTNTLLHKTMPSIMSVAKSL